MLEYEIQLFPTMVGAVINLDKVPDQVFANRLVGDGIAIDPYTNIVYAPLSGVVRSIHKSKHAITIISQYGFDVLIHIGIDTVTLSGRGFTPLVKEGDKVHVHDKMRLLKCQWCDRSFSHKHNLLRHVLEVHERIRPFKCHVCGKSFAQNCYLQSHLQRVHEKVNPIKCQQCDKSFSHQLFAA